ncbi:DUF192 domain-containing protein [Tsuneonella sp. HG222]
MRPVAKILLAAAACVLTCTSAACSTQAAAPVPAAETPSVHPFSGLEVVPLTIAQGDRVHRFRVEVAQTEQQQNQGLMFRRSMAPDEGMIFPSERPYQRSFWMKNTVIPLDLLFIGADRKVVNIIANAEPYSLDSLLSEGPVIAVLELNGGRAAELGIAPGAKVEW